MPKSDQAGLQRLLAATACSMAGLRAAWRHEAAFRQELLLLLVLVPLAFWLGQTPGQCVLLLGSGLLVLVVELLNSAIEAVVDRIGPEIHPLSGRAKDLGSAAVLLSLVLLAATWAAVALERFSA